MLYQIFIESYYQLPKGIKTIVIDVFEETTVFKIKEKILKFTGIPIERQILRFNKNNLNDNDVISQISKIAKEVIIKLYIK